MIDQDEIKICLIDDDEGHAELVKMNLERSGLINEIVHFSSGQKLIDFLFGDPLEHHGNKYLMIMDINMPGFDGHQVLARIKGDERTKTIPVIMLTTAQDEQEVQRCYAMGCNFYMSKPMEYADLSEAIRELGLFIQKTKIPGASLLVAAGAGV